MENPYIKYDLGKGLFVDSYSIDPEFSCSRLEEMLKEKDNKESNQKNIDSNFRDLGYFDSFNDLNIEFLDRTYSVPGFLETYRKALGEYFDKKGKFNGPVALVNGALDIPLRLFKGGYYDFKATELSAVPSQICKDYPEAKTNKELFKLNEIDENSRARYLGITYILSTDNQEKICTIHRQKGLLVAPDCIATPGSTPPYKDDFNKPGFDFNDFYLEHISQEMNEEFLLNKDEFKVRGFRLIDEPSFIPYFAVEVDSSIGSKDIAQRLYKNESAISEHPVLYFSDIPSTKEFINRFPIFPGCKFALDKFLD
jgi:hypothetical protein